MKDVLSENIIKRASRLKKYDDSEILSLQKYITLLAKYANKKFPDLKPLEAGNAIINLMDTINNEYVKIANFSGSYYQLMAARQLKADPKYIREKCENIDVSKIKEPDFYYEANFQNNKYYALIELVYALKKIEEKNGAIADRRTKTAIPLEEKVNLIMDKYVSLLEADTKEKTIKNLKFIAETLNEFGLLDDAQDRYEERMNSLGFPKIATEGQKPSEFFTEENLNKLDVDTLLVLNLFYENRLAKEISALGEAFFSIDTLGMWPQIKKKGALSLDGKTLNTLKNKARCIDELNVRMFDFATSKRKLTEKENEQGYSRTDIQENRNFIVKQEGKNYKRIFDEALPRSQNDLEDDMCIYQVMLNIRENCYKIRETYLVGLLYYLNNMNSSKNYGVIRDELVNGKLVDTLDKEFILIGIDFEGLNMPIRLHTRKKTLIDVLRPQQGKPILPEYEGGLDFSIDGRNIPTDLLMPLTKKQKKEIREAYNAAEEGTDTKKFISHLRFLKDKGDTKFPRHLMIKRKVGDKEVYERGRKKYVNLATKKEFYLEGDKYVAVDEGARY